MIPVKKYLTITFFPRIYMYVFVLPTIFNFNNAYVVNEND